MWGKNVEVGDVCCQLQVIDGQKYFGVLVGEDVLSYGSSECYSPYVTLSGWDVADSAHAGEGSVCCIDPCGGGAV